MVRRYSARLSRLGIQHYPEHGRSELRSAAEVFHPASLAGLDGLRVQIDHVPEMGRAVGRVLPGSVRRDGDHVAATLEIEDASTIAAIDRGELREISLGYSAEVIRDASGTWHQRNIRFERPGAHVALVKRARCGASCSIGQRDSMSKEQRTDSGGAIVSDALGCNCADQAERDRMLAYLDHYSELHGVHRDAIVAEVIRVHGPQAQASKDLIRDAAARLNAPVNAPAVYHDGTRSRARTRGNVDSDDNFRAALVHHTDGPDLDPVAATQEIIQRGLAESKRLEKQHAAALAGQQPDDDDAFRSGLAGKL